ncbi:MAG: Hsp20/alpha crystallin family protein [Nitrospirae bacterium]|nr:MAG: Hsp20/alpha crystallin family protein [Nitrospirota bacterium]
MSIKDLMPFKKKDVPVKREEDNPIALLRRDIDSLFDNFFRGFAMEPLAGHLAAFSPNVDITETDKEIKVTAELPGMDEKDIDVSLNKDMLTIKGEKKEEKEDKGKNYYRVERSFGSFSRTIPLPVEIETEKIGASFKKGVLTVTLPKSAKAIDATRKINVKVE